MELWLKIIDHCKVGISLLYLIWCLPTIIYFTGTSKHSLGRYNLDIGRIWNYKLPKGIMDFTIINHLEFLAFLVQILLEEYKEDLDNEYILG